MLNQCSIFISYRRKDSGYATGTLYEALCVEFGKKRIFKDEDSIPSGADFRQHIEKTLERCNLCLVVIGKDWLTVRSEKGLCRLHEPNDWVRIEIETALQKNKHIIPVLLDNTRMPSASSLPETLKDLQYRNAIEVRPGKDTKGDTERLIKDIKKHVKSQNKFIYWISFNWEKKILRLASSIVFLGFPSLLIVFYVVFPRLSEFSSSVSPEAPNSPIPETPSPIPPDLNSPPRAEINSPGSSIPSLPRSKILVAYGERGKNAYNLIENLRCAGYYNKLNDSYFGPVTQKALKQFQQANRLNPDGVVGSQTQALLANACSPVKPTPRNPSKPSPPSSDIIAVGSRGSHVYTLIEQLRCAGYYNKKNDSYFGPVTQKALQQFQQDNGLNVTGNADAQTLELLSRACQTVAKTISLGAKGSHVYALIEQLRCAGYYNKLNDSYFGPVTQKALKQFQQAHGLRVTGVADSRTQARLDAVC